MSLATVYGASLVPAMMLAEEDLRLLDAPPRDRPRMTDALVRAWAQRWGVRLRQPDRGE